MDKCRKIFGIALNVVSNLSWNNCISSCAANRRRYDRISFQGSTNLQRDVWIKDIIQTGLRLKDSTFDDQNIYSWTYFFECRMFCTNFYASILFLFIASLSITSQWRHSKWKCDSKTKKRWQNEHVPYNILTFWQLYKTIVFDGTHKVAYKVN